MKVNLIKKVLLIITIVVIGIPLLFVGGVAGYNLFQNLNPSFVNLDKDGFVKVFSFVTEKKKILVDVYGRPGKEKNTGEFVVVRTGLLPFGMKAVSAKVVGEAIWTKGLSIIPTTTHTTTKDNPFYWLSLRIDLHYINIPKLETGSSVYCHITYDTLEKRMAANTDYTCADYIPYFPYIEHFRIFNFVTYLDSYSEPHDLIEKYQIYKNHVLTVFPLIYKEAL